MDRSRPTDARKRWGMSTCEVCGSATCVDPQCGEPMPAVPADDSGGAWIAYYSDYSGIVLFTDELSALRHAVGNSMSEKFVRHGEEIR
jgi:hypothetical protein